MADLKTNVIYCGDNLEVLPKYVDSDSIDLIYIDPPFNSSRNYEVFWGEAQERRAFEDRFGDAMTYLDWMRPRIRELHRVLKPTGSFYYHCDWHASHYIKVELDRVFGFNNFQNEIVWERATAHYDSRKFRSVHDVVFFYSKSTKFTFNRQFGPYSEAYVRSHYNLRDEDGRLYQLDNLTAPEPRPGTESDYEWKGHRPPPGGHWRYSRSNMEKLEKEGRIVYTKSGRPRYKRYLDEMPGVPRGDVWSDIPPVNSQAAQRLGYPTQKPVALMDRIIRASSNEGDTVLDAFCGCGTTLEAAAKYKRRWIGIDFSPTACRVMSQRLEALGLKEGRDFEVRDMPKTEDDLRRMPHFEFQNWAVIALGGIPNRVKVGDYGIDGRLYVADVTKEKKPGRDLFGEIDNWYPIQVKQQDRAGRPDLDKFETAMRRDKRLKGYFIAFGFSTDATKEMKRANREDGLDIVPITVKELLEHERRVG
jgi:DNA modification methylase